MADLIDKVAALIIEDKKLLLTWEEKKGFFLFPGGKREAFDADDCSCLNREIEEELSANPISLEYFGTYESEFKGTPIKLTAYLVRLDRQPIASREITALKYIGTKEYESVKDKMLPISHQVFKELVALGLVD